jgi:predicted aspartyl protease
MILGALVLLSSSLLSVKPAPVFADVFVGTHGPYRFLVDTGAQTSLIDPKLATELGLHGQFTVDVVTQYGTQHAPALKTGELRIGERTLPETELAIHDVRELRRLDRSVRGLLGIDALRDSSFTLSPSTGRLEFTAERPAGEVVPFYRVEGRLALKARMGSEVLTLILDSGSTNVVLFRRPEAMARTSSVSAAFGTVDGARRTVPTTWTADMFFDRLRVGMLPAAIVERKGGQAAGLLPASVFRAVHIDQEHSLAVLVR